MSMERTFWTHWAQSLHRWGLKDGMAFLLEAAGPLNVIFAQMVYAGEPFFSTANPSNSWQALAQLLEDKDERQSFAAFLRAEESE